MRPSSQVIIWYDALPWVELLNVLLRPGSRLLDFSDGGKVGAGLRFQKQGESGLFSAWVTTVDVEHVSLAMLMHHDMNRLDRSMTSLHRFAAAPVVGGLPTRAFLARPSEFPSLGLFRTCLRSRPGVVHRDLKPASVLLFSGGWCLQGTTAYISKISQSEQYSNPGFWNILEHMDPELSSPLRCSLSEGLGLR